MTRRRLALRIDETPAEDDLQSIVAKLRAFNADAVGRPVDPRKFAVWVKDGDGVIVGGIIGITYWDWLYVDYLYLDEGLRRAGWGRRLLEKAEKIAIERGCRGAWLDTFSFQAPGFYRGMGYTEFASMDEHPKGHSRHFFVKRLSRRRATRRR